MADLLDTRPSLLVRIRNPRDDVAWSQFAGLYTPLIAGFVRKRGLQAADVDDLTQTILCDLSSAIRRLDYDPGKGMFRAWLFTVVRRHLIRFQNRIRKTLTGSGDSEVQCRLEQQPAGTTDEMEWENEYRLRRFRWAAERVRIDFTESSWQAFWRSAVEGLPPATVARDLGLTLGAVYVAKSRILDRIRAEIRLLGDE